jgi:hypothetical protein
MQHSLLPQLFSFLLPDRCIWLRRDGIWITASEAPGAVRSVDWICIFRAPAWRWLDEYVTVDSTFYSLHFKQEAAAAPFYFHSFLLIAFLEEAFVRNRSILCINCIIIMCSNNNVNNAVINDSYWRLQDLILLFKSSMCTREEFFEIYWQFGHARSERFASRPRHYAGVNGQFHALACGKELLARIEQGAWCVLRTFKTF